MLYNAERVICSYWSESVDKPYMDAGCGWNLQVPPHTGTKVVAVAYNGDVVLGADSRVSSGTCVSNRASDNLTPLSDFMWLLRSGSAADTRAVADHGELGSVDGPW